ncbi:hypothetical protein [Caulobacter sp. 17J65-9]|uniref:hypothetical protein n=1 Tax=Caulobacter sp. 17J65-9 TaxID=2709382 RepID=UPI0013CBDE69|nr:hypothetical protein [Caulobacter sp. 17J65-9]NEX95309.1 hypothetical protein [Caulobacter sp. 17J65-9]
MTATAFEKDAPLLSEASAKGALTIRVYRAGDLVGGEKRRHDAAERLRCAGLLQCTVRLGERRTVQGDQWAEYLLTPKGLAWLREAAPRRPLREALRLLFGARPARRREPDDGI